MSKKGFRVDVTDENMVIGNRLREAREKAGIGKREMSRLFGVEISRIINLEYGRSGMQSGTLLRACKAYNITPNELLGFEGVNDDKAKIANMFNSLNEANKDILIEMAKVLLKSEGGQYGKDIKTV